MMPALGMDIRFRIPGYRVVSAGRIETSPGVFNGVVAGGPTLSIPGATAAELNIKPLHKLITGVGSGSTIKLIFGGASNGN